MGNTGSVATATNGGQAIASGGSTATASNGGVATAQGGEGPFGGGSLAVASGTGASATSTFGGIAIATSNGMGSSAQAVSTGGFAESTALGVNAKSKAGAAKGKVDIDRTVVGEDGQALNTHFPPRE